MVGLMDNFSTDNRVFSTYVFYTAVLVIKTLLMAFLTVIHRVKNKVNLLNL